MRLKTVIQVTRAPFFASLVSSVLVGAAIAWKEGFFHPGYLLLTVLGIICVNAGMNMGNDYFDHLSGNDLINRELTPFSGGSRTIQEGILTARQVLAGSLLFYTSASVIGLYLSVMRGWPVLWVGLIGMFLALFSNAPPFRLNYVGHGLAELATGLGAGPLIVLGSYYVQAQRLTQEALCAGLAMGFLGAALIYINEFPDHDADKAVGKTTLVVVLGRERAVRGYMALLGGVYAVVAVGTAMGVFPYTMWVVLLTLPLARKSIQVAMRFHSDTPRLIPAMAGTIQLYLANAILICLAYSVARFL
jgi:1,4-dihydroxy-2-naphthoate octaprenyltransferase